jgi:hypothetical protein
LFQVKAIRLVFADKAAMFQGASNGEGQVRHIDGLEKEIDGPSFHQVDGERRLIFSREENDFDGGIRLLEGIEKQRAGDMRHPEVQDADVRPKGLEDSEGKAGIAETADFVTLMLQEFANEGNDLNFIIDNENAPKA